MTGMKWRMTRDVAEFLSEAGDFLRADRVRNTVILTVTETMRARPARLVRPVGGPADDPDRFPVFGWWTGGARGAFMHTPPFPVVLTEVPGEAIPELVTALVGRPLAGVNARPAQAAAFAEAWRAGAGCRVRVHRRTRLYRLTELSWPDPAPAGAGRVAAESDAALLTGWFTDFAAELNDMGADADHAAIVREKLGYGGVTIWEADGEPVSIAGMTRQVAGMIRIGPVYTPPALRGHGYASAVTAAISQRARAAGTEEVLLYTDLANPVSNSIYQRIGYRPVEDQVVLAFPAR